MVRVRAKVETWYSGTKMPGDEFDCEEDHAKLLSLIEKVEYVQQKEPETYSTRAMEAKEDTKEGKAPKGKYNRMDMRAKD